MTDDIDDENWVSKSALKREATRAQQLGEQLLSVPQDVLEGLELDETLFDAIMLAKRIKQHNGRRRQIQLIGKLMRRIDISPIEAALAQLHQTQSESRDALHLAERVRDNIIENGESDINRLLDHCSAEAIAKVSSEYKQLKNTKPNTPNYKKHSRNIFRLVRDALQTAG